MDDCYTLPQVRVSIRNNDQILTLFDNKIIAFNKEVEINFRKRKITKIKNKMIFITVNGTNEILTIENDVKRISSYELDKYEIDLKHTNLFDKNFDPIKQIDRITKIRELNGHFYLIPDNTFVNTTEVVVNTFNSIHFVFASLHALIIEVIITVVALYVRIRIRKRIKKQLTQVVKFVKKENQNNESDSEKVILNTTSELEEKIDQESIVAHDNSATQSNKLELMASLNKNMEIIKEL